MLNLFGLSQMIIIVDPVLDDYYHILLSEFEVSCHMLNYDYYQINIRWSSIVELSAYIMSIHELWVKLFLVDDRSEFHYSEGFIWQQLTPSILSSGFEILVDD